MKTPPEQDQEQNQLATRHNAVSLYRRATDVASIVGDMVEKTAVEIAGRKYVCVEGWTSIAVAYDCIATIKPDSVVKVVEDGRTVGIKAVAQLRRQSDLAILAEAEGFVGEEEVDWYGSKGQQIERWSKKANKMIKVTVEKRPDHAIRSMAQTRAVSRVCRNAFSHVVVMMDKGLSTTPAEDVIDVDATRVEEEERGAAPEKKSEPTATPPAAEKKAEPSVPRDVDPELRKQFEGGKWKPVQIHFGKDKGVTLGELANDKIKKLEWWVLEWHPKPYGNKPIAEDDKLLRAALDVCRDEEPYFAK